ncbi:MAG: tyrosine-type recombinase/integrase [Fimbriimonas sp.]
MKDKRRQNHEGTYQTLSNGTIRHVVQVNGRRVYGPPAKTKTEARKKLAAKLEEQSRPKPETPQTLEFFYFEQLGRMKKTLAQTTYALYETVYEQRIRPHAIATVDISALKPEDVQRWVDDLGALSPRSVARYLQCLKAVLQHAVRLGKIPSNPATPIRTKKADEHQKTLLTKEAVERLLALKMTPRMRTAVLLCLHGLRRAEACGIRYEDIDEDGITIRRQILEVNGKVVVREATKTGRTRWVPIGPSLKEAIGEGKGYVLATSAKTPLRPRNLAREWTVLVKGTEFEPLTLHDLRSTFGTLLLESGIDVRTASELMGHSPAMLASIYARSRKDLKREALSKVFG